MIVRMEGVTKRYGDLEALSAADLLVPEGSVMGLIGPNGAGKTTSILIISTLLGREEGVVEVAGVDPAEDPDAVRRILGYMPDYFGMYERVTSYEYLEFFASAHRIPAARRPALVGELLELVGLTAKRDVDVNTLSRGMKQRLSLARALVHDPTLLVLDEPASGLDPRARVELRELIAELGRLDKTVVISSHILAELEGMCSHLAVIDEGKVLAQGELATIRNELTGHRRVRARIADDSLDAVEDLLATDPRVADTVLERGRLGFTLDGDEDAQAELLRRVIESGVIVYEWNAEVAGLEEVFLRITGRGDG